MNIKNAKKKKKVEANVVELETNEVTTILFFCTSHNFWREKKVMSSNIKKKSTNILQKSINYALEQSIVVVEVIDDVVITNNDLTC